MQIKLFFKGAGNLFEDYYDGSRVRPLNYKIPKNFRDQINSF